MSQSTPEPRVEVRYAMLRPAQIVERRQTCPVAYIPIGTLEWHGLHNPLGADTLQAEGLAMRCAEKGGGLVMPPLYYGESRIDSLVDTSPEWDGPQIARAMQLPFENFAPDHQPFPAVEQALNYHKLLLHILAEVQTMGFELGVLVAGHYPLIDHARMAALQFNRWACSRWRAKAMLAWAMVDFWLVRDEHPQAGDHGGKWETSHLMALHPLSVDLDTLEPGDARPTGVFSHQPLRESTAAFGNQTLDAAADKALREVAHRLSHKAQYQGHGASLREGLWQA